MGKPRPDITPQRVNQLYLQGKYLHEVAEILGTTIQTVYTRIDRSIIRRKGNPTHFPEDKVQELKHLYVNQKLPTPQIAKIFGFCEETIRKHLRQSGVQMRTRGNPPGQPLKDSPVYTARGYVLVLCPNHPRARKSGYVLEHILVWEKHHKRPLPPDYLVHHLNGIKDDNRPSNLVAMRRSEHTNQTSPFKKRIRELELEMSQLRRALEDKQAILYISEN